MDKTTKLLIVITLAFILLTGGGIAYLKLSQKSVTTNSTVGNIDTDKTYIAIMDTSMGTIKMELNPKAAPKTVNNFVSLAQKKYYDGLIFHRVSKDFVIQTGDPTGTGTGGESIYGKSFDDEIDAKSDLYKTGYVKGVLAMANSGPNTNGSQFFIMAADSKTLPANYTIFGKVTGGQDVVDAIDQVPLENGVTDGKPVTAVKVNSITIEEK